MRRAGALLLALGTLPESARPADMKGLPEAPSGYVLLQHHSVGNSANCGGAGGPGHGCHNMDPPDQLKNAGCGPGAAACFEQAKVACETDKRGCVAFALRCVGSDDPTKVNGFQTYRAGIGNAVPNDDWYLYAQPKVCGSCPAGSIQAVKPPMLDSSPEGALRPAYSYPYQCADIGNGMNKKNNAPIYCYASVSCAPHPGSAADQSHL